MLKTLMVKMRLEKLTILLFPRSLSRVLMIRTLTFLSSVPEPSRVSFSGIVWHLGVNGRENTSLSTWLIYVVIT